MSGFIATNSSSEESAHVMNNGFFPDIDLAVFRAVMRVEQTITSERAVQGLQDAMIVINKELHSWQIDAKAQSLAEIRSETYGEKTRLVQLYETAVFNRAKAALLETYRDFDTTKSGHQRADEMETGIDGYLRKSREAIRNILGIPRMTVELI